LDPGMTKRWESPIRSQLGWLCRSNSGFRTCCRRSEESAHLECRDWPMLRTNSCWTQPATIHFNLEASTISRLVRSSRDIRRSTDLRLRTPSGRPRLSDESSSLSSKEIKDIKVEAYVIERISTCELGGDAPANGHTRKREDLASARPPRAFR